MSGASYIALRSEEIFAQHYRAIQVQTDRMFAILFAIQWPVAILLAFVVSPLTWSADESSLHVHVWAAVVLGGALSSLPILLALCQPGEVSTRMIISAAQVGYSALLIHLTGGRIETHFHVFGSLAFLSFYRDWRVFVPATLIVAADHLIRGFFWPESVFGVLVAAPWRAFEHAGWVIFEDIFLVWSCLTGVRDLKATSTATAELEHTNATIEEQVRQRTEELQSRTSELEESLKKSRELETQLLQAQKLESIGQLAAGIAHEINTPMQYVSDNIEFLSECSENLFSVVDIYRRNLHDIDSPRDWQSRIAETEEAIEQCRFNDIREQLPEAIEESLEGSRRVIKIVRAMKEFSHPGTSEKVLTDLNEAIRSTVAISRNRWKYVANLDLTLDPTIPQVMCLPAEMNQVFLNVVVNAADAIAESHRDGSAMGTITIRTRLDDQQVVIEVEDTGCGMSEHVRKRVFDPFFTTKKVGKGTGQGLAICYNVVVNKHDGSIDVQSEPGGGAKFTVRIPIGAAVENQEPGAPLSQLDLASEALDTPNLVRT